MAENTMPTLDLGISQEELREQIIDRAAERLAKYLAKRDDTYQPIRDVVMETVETVTRRIADEEVRPWAEGQIENLVMQRTNSWGEATGKPTTFREYLIEMAEKYMNEPVDYEGRTQNEQRGYSFKKATTRLAFMIDKHLHFHIERAMKDALANANSAIVGGIQETVRVKLAEISEKLKVEVKR